jgi:hypothetical protein
MTDKPTPMPDEMVRGMIENSNETLKAIREIRGGDNLPIKDLVGLVSLEEKTMTDKQLQEIWCEVNFLWEQYVATKDELSVGALALRQMLIDSFVEILRKDEEGEWRAWL